ncbi:MAG: bifunctional methylenetetrahydrofolate dehydrogenase/methenyltetrahydrofolate cyclohydrolase FolD [Gammaproteobacteria bacterium]|jgi:methylenetetrahydrofolate dehydrogenase (NADP+)/methenyltetrahydrofolate cyclohydrolase|nr:bifunctional methylenetetrahydrofolate dehydrogenase/methenyltetrahydrofolate cyclohydrolase FolD [Gammaproteobacteria bacterium]
MTAKIIDGKAIAAQIRQEAKNEVEVLKDRGVTPCLAAVLVGDVAASKVYVKNKRKACENIGIASVLHTPTAEISEPELLKLIDELNHDQAIHGILVQLPLPKHIDETKVIEAIDPSKDVDGFHPYNVGRLVIGLDTFRSCTPAGVQELLLRSGIDVAGQHVVIIGRSNIVGKPMANIVVQKQKGANATVTICHSRTRNLPEITRQADILISALGQPQFVKPDMVKQGAVVIDVGINRIDDPSSDKGYKLVGDVDFEPVSKVASAVTPVPGGVGPMTVAMLMVNTIKAARMLLK